MTENQNMSLWDSFGPTNPGDTKDINYGSRKVTAILAHSQVRDFTGAFGPAGKGWGFECRDVQYPPTDSVALKVGLMVEGFPLPLEQWGQASLYVDAGKKRPDMDAFKKAMTDGITKLMAYLGLNADVHLGKFDDNKYVADLKTQSVKDAPPALTADEPPLDKSEATVVERDWPHWVKDQIAGFAEYKTPDDLKFWQSTQAATLTELQQSNPALHDQVRASFKARKSEVNPNG